MITATERNMWPLLAACGFAAVTIVALPPASFEAASALAWGRTLLDTHDSLGAGWLGALASYAIWKNGGYPLLAAFDMLLAAFAAYQVDERCSARGLSFAARSLALLILSVMSLGAIRVGGGMADVAFAAALLRLLDAERPSWKASALVTMVWCNVSSFGLLAPLLALIACPRTPIFAAVSALAMLGTPAGIALPKNALAELRLDGTSAWQPMQVSAPAFLYGFVPTAVLAAIFGLRRAGAERMVLALAALILAQLNGIYLGVAGALLAPLVAEAFDAARLEWSGRDEAERETLRVAPAMLVPIVVVVAALAVQAIVQARGTNITDGASAPAAAIEYLAREGVHRRVFCLRAEWCALARFRNAPGIEVVPGERNKGAQPDVAMVRRVKPGWEKTLDRWQADAVLTTPYGMGSLLSLSPHWQRVAAFDGVWVFERR